MDFPKKFMRKSELVAMGLPAEMLERAYREKGQNFARKINPLKPNSPVVFETDSFEKWWNRQVVC